MTGSLLACRPLDCGCAFCEQKACEAAVVATSHAMPPASLKDAIFHAHLKGAISYAGACRFAMDVVRLCCGGYYLH
jgi:hypothetical protein